MNDETFRGNRQGANFSTGSNTTDGRLTARATVKGQTNRDLRMRDDGASDGAKIVLEDVRACGRLRGVLGCETKVHPHFKCSAKYHFA